MFRCLGLLLLLAVGRAQSLQDKPGSVCGMVQDENGAPAKSLFVTAFWMGSHSGPMFGGRTDEEGHYCVPHLTLGTYRMFATDDRRGYTESSGPFPAASVSTQVTLDAAHPAATVDFRIPYKAAFLTVLFSDAATGRPITPRSRTVSLAARSDPEHRWSRDSSDAGKTMLVPPDEDVYVNVHVDGYRAWPGDGSKGMVVNYAQGSTHTMNVKLTPSAGDEEKQGR